MTIDMYGEKVAEASALIREFAKVDYFHYFARDPESSLEEFIAMLDQAEEKGRQSQAARIAELERQIVEVQAECIKRGADLLERQLAEASAPAVEQQPVGEVWADINGTKRAWVHDQTLAEGAKLYAAPQAAEPVREVPGWKLVPIEPTEGMLAQYQEFIRAGLHYMDVTIWKAMLAAAPLPAAPVQQEGSNG